MRPWRILALAVLLTAIFIGAGLLLGGSKYPHADSFVQTMQADDLRLTLRLNQAAVGQSTVDVSVQNATGELIDVRKVRLQFTMAEMDMGMLAVDTQPLGRGHVQARGSFFAMVGRWNVEATVDRDGHAPVQAIFAIPIAAPGEASGPLNPLTANQPTILAGHQLYLEQCAACHGATGRGDGSAAAGLSPRPADFTQHMSAGTHTDGQIFLWIKDGFPGSAMPAWSKRLSEEQIWQLVTYLRIFGQTTPMAQAGPPTASGLSPHIDVKEPLPPLIFARRGEIWRSDGSAAAPRALTNLPAESYAIQPAAATDGRIAFVTISPAPVTATVPLPLSTLYVINADGSAAHAVWKPPHGVLGMPTWVPNGQTLYLAANGLHSTSPTTGATPVLEIIRLDLATGTTRTILENAFDPTIARDGTQLAFVRPRRGGDSLSVAVAALDGSGTRQVIDGTDFAGFYAPRFSPDGKRLVVAAVGGPQTDAQGVPIKLSSQSLFQRVLAALEPPAAEAHGAPWDLWVVNIDGSGLRRLTNIYEDMPMAAYAPDGAQLAFMGAGGIYMMNSDGSNLRRLDPLGEHGGLDWARDR